MEEIKLNSHGVNAAIKHHVLSDERMKELGFRYYTFKDGFSFWYLIERIVFPKDEKYDKFINTFNVMIIKDCPDVKIFVMDERAVKEYDYQGILKKDPSFEPCLVIKEQVENWMEFLQDNGVLSGHVRGEYI